ncbi:MAG: hypothetical protein ABEH40_06095 [Haloferacaceae archaeon]
MSQPDHDPTADGSAAVHEEYALGVRILERPGDDGPRYRFEAPDHEGIGFDDAGRAELYADVYFDVNGFVEAGTGRRGIPPELVQAGKDSLAAYLLTMPDADVDWVASFYGKTPDEIERYLATVRRRAAEIRDGLADRGRAEDG